MNELAKQPEVQTTEASEMAVVEATPIVEDRERALIDIQISTAHAYPRSIKAFREKALSMATLDIETASRCFYVLPKGGKKIEGPGVRLSEIVASSWRNLRVKAGYVGETDDRKSVVAEGMCWDLETNVAVSIQVTRRIVDKYGKRYRDDVIETTKLAATSIAKRNAIFNIVPMNYVQAIYEAAKRLAVGDATSLSDRRQKMLEYFSKFGVTPDRVLARVEKQSIEDIDLTDMEMLVGLSTAMKDGDIDADVAFPLPQEAEGKEKKTLQEKVKAKAGRAKKTKAAVEGVVDAVAETLKPEEKAEEREPGAEG